jgi:hypothetical protein
MTRIVLFLLGLAGVAVVMLASRFGGGHPGHGTREVARTSAASTAPRVPRLRAPAPGFAGTQTPPAGPPAPASAAEESEAVIGALKASGQASARLIADAEAALVPWQSANPDLARRVSFSRWSCFAAGCWARSRFPQMSRVAAMVDAIDESQGLEQWPGGKYRSGPIETGAGNFEVVWVLYASTANLALKGREP